jgi:flagellar motility protein MotE (MotC chaperone)
VLEEGNGPQDVIYITHLGGGVPIAILYRAGIRMPRAPPLMTSSDRPLLVGHAERHDVDDFLQLKGYSSLTMTDFLRQGAELPLNTNNRRLLIAATVSSAVATVAFGGCVMQSTYDAAVQEGLTTRTELLQALEEQKALTRQISEIELRNADIQREAEAAVAALRQAQDEADHEREQTEQRLAKWKQKAAQAVKQQHALQYGLTVARENGAALQELIDVYQRKVRDGAMASTAEAAVHKPFDPSTIPEPQELPPAPAVTPPQPAQPPLPGPEAHPVKSPPPPADEGWFSSIKGWLMSLWRSVFS